MGFFDFLKKKELSEIEQLKAQVKALGIRVQELYKFQHLVDTEKEANRLVKTAEQQAEQIIQAAEAESRGLTQRAEELIASAIQKDTIASSLYRDETERALKEFDAVLNAAKSEARQLKQQASAVYNDALQRADVIIKDAEAKAIEIAGNAYTAMREAANLKKTIVALKNTINGYGDEYLIPTYSLLDQLAEDVGYTEAGQELANARAKTRLMIKNHLVGQCEYVEDYRRTTAINFIIDAFNGKVDIIFASIKHDNFGTLKQKIIDAYQLVNNLGVAFRNAAITPSYLEARLDELKWAIVAIELKNQEREEQRRIKEQLREEEKAKREFEKAIKDAEKDEDAIRKALEKATKELEAASIEQKQKYEAKLNELNERLKIAEEKGRRALSMAQQTKSGYVYVISNVGSFGENIYKIGMTRRLEPVDRIKELGDASVPFSFDVHAMVYCENAPSLETELHKFFLRQQLNKVNPRKEFFRVGIAEIRNKIDAMNLQTEWTMAADAAEYRESLAIEKSLSDSGKEKEWELSQQKILSKTTALDEMDAQDN